MGPLTLLILALATWRVSAMFVNEGGPASIFKRLRELSGIRHDPDGAILMVPDRFFAGLLSCVWCASVWVGAGWMLLWYFLPETSVLVASVFALSAVAVVLDRLFSKP